MQCSAVEEVKAKGATCVSDWHVLRFAELICCIYVAVFKDGPKYCCGSLDDEFVTVVRGLAQLLALRCLIRATFAVLLHT